MSADLDETILATINLQFQGGAQPRILVFATQITRDSADAYHQQMFVGRHTR